MYKYDAFLKLRELLETVYNVADYNVTGNSMRESLKIATETQSAAKLLYRKIGESSETILEAKSKDMPIKKINSAGHYL